MYLVYLATSSHSDMRDGCRRESRMTSSENFPSRAQIVPMQNDASDTPGVYLGMHSPKIPTAANASVALYLGKLGNVVDDG